MSITDELREWAETARVKDVVLTTYPAKHAVHGIYEQLLDIADRIDSEYQKAIRELNNLADDSVLLPVDADGEYVHIGDVMEDADGEVFTVSSIDYGFHMSPNREVACWMLLSIDAEFDEPADQCRHHHEPTVDDVLREFAEKIIDSQIPGMRPTYDEAIAEYAKRLMLAE